MPMALRVRADFSPEALEKLAQTTEDRAQARRLRAISAILRGASRQEAASLGGMQRQTLRDWVQKFNNKGPDGLSSRKPPGRPAKLTTAQKRDLLAFLLSRSDQIECNAYTWRLADISALVAERYGIQLNEISVGRLLRSAGMTYNGFGWLKPIKTMTSNHFSMRDIITSARN